MSSETSEESLQRASELADMAIIDMSDNANKMGTDIEMIKNAYAGFAKQNYTMLDNLKLGYGGTREEMERLLADAEELTGKKYDMSSYADIVEAIHAIQTEMGITGTTAEEAEHTISGSAKAMKSAWQNMLVTFADRKGDTKKATANLVRTAKNFYENISPVIMQSIAGIGDFLTEIAPMVGEELPKIVSDLVPKLFTAGVSLVKGLAKGIYNAVKNIKLPSWEEIKAIAMRAWEKIKEGVANLGGLIFGKNEDGTVHFPTWDEVKTAITNAWNTIVTEAGKLTGFEFGDINSVADLIGKIEEAWTNLRSTVEGKAIEIGKYFFGEGKEKEVADAVKNILDVLVAFGAGFAIFKAVTAVQSMVKTLKTLFTLDAGTSKVALILGGIATAFMLIYENWDTVQPILQEAWSWVDSNIIQPMSEFFDNLSKWVTGAINDIKRLLGLEVREGEGLLSNLEAGELKQGYQFMQNTKNGKANPNGIKVSEEQFYSRLNESLTKAGMSAEEIDAVTQKIKDSDDPQWVLDFIDSLQKADDKAKALGTAIDEGIPKDVDVHVRINVDDPEGILFGTGVFARPHKVVPGFAKGLPSVPYDGFLANLHRGEAVLTKSQARDYREGNSGIDLGALEDRIENAIRRGMDGVSVRSFLNGKDITDEVNRQNINAVKGRRFAT